MPANFCDQYRGSVPSGDSDRGSARARQAVSAGGGEEAADERQQSGPAHGHSAPSPPPDHRGCAREPRCRRGGGKLESRRLPVSAWTRVLPVPEDSASKRRNPKSLTLKEVA